MAVSPNDVGLSPEELDRVLQIEREIDAILRRDYVQGKAIQVRVSVTTSLEINASVRIRNELLRRYESVGWDISTISQPWTFSSGK